MNGADSSVVGVLGNTVGWSVQERYRGGLSWLSEEAGLSVGWWYFILGLRVPVWMRGGVDTKRRCEVESSIFRITRAKKPRTGGSLTWKLANMY